MSQFDMEAIVEKVLQELSRRTEAKQPGGGEQTTEPADAGTIYFPEEKEMGLTNPRNPQTIERARQITPARIAIGRAGTRMKTTSYLQFRIDQAAAHDAVMKDVSEDFLRDLGLPVLKTRAADIQEYLMNLDVGRKLCDESVQWLKENGQKGKDVQIIVSDGLSSSAVEANTKDLLSALLQGLKLKHISVGQPVFIKRGRVWVQDEVAALVGCEVVVSLIGERPGLATAESLSAYMIYRPNENSVESDRTVISNIHRGGTPPIEAGAHLADLIEDILRFKASGVKYMQLKNS
ncbi:ethanolamine ammonia-lyase subunit EutC [Brevibacillus massiliensis]|uniref:ethanolamine ammonia-lyase subunit EutC n=1 Tax=Brevibacillus massiliensis TaxID=1118054 RepID=UPI0002E39D1A|nr:ethanolamine ammonia-lyase subunit EutC [Brevibacillus massiliensis]